MEFLDVPYFPIFFGGYRKKYLQGFNALGGTPFNDSAEDIVEMGYKTGPTPSQIGGVRLSETKGAHRF